ncbi:MAG: NAD(P)/FAD-dependent oxidoreductase [Candidatus Nitrosocosmicus sp.]
MIDNITNKNNDNNLHKILIIGSGPAGLTAAIYAARGGMEPIVISGDQPGGQLILTNDVENFPGFNEPVLGSDLMTKMRNQAERVGTKFIDKSAITVDFSTKPFNVIIDGSDDVNIIENNDIIHNNNNNIKNKEDKKLLAESIIIATGASAMWLGLNSESRLKGRGVSACATCDGFFFRNKDVVVVGGGDTALEEALFLTKLVKSVIIIHRRNELRASKILQQRVFYNTKISFIWNTMVEDILGQDKVEGIKIKNTRTGEIIEIKCDGVFIAIGHKPNTDIFRGQVEIDDKGYIKRYEETKTSVEGIFVAGDAYDYTYRQAITAAGSGCKASLDAIRYLELNFE